MLNNRTEVLNVQQAINQEANNPPKKQMKNLILSIAITSVVALNGQAQQLLFQDNGNNSTDTTIGGVPNYSQDLNLDNCHDGRGDAAPERCHGQRDHRFGFCSTCSWRYHPQWW